MQGSYKNRGVVTGIHDSACHKKELNSPPRTIVLHGDKGTHETHKIPLYYQLNRERNRPWKMWSGLDIATVKLVKLYVHLEWLNLILLNAEKIILFKMLFMQ